VLYVVLVVAADVLLGLPRQDSPVIQIAATAAAVLAFAPARTLLTRVADRLAYGARPDPYDVLARMSSLSQATLSGVAALPSLALVAGEGLGARACEIRLIRPDGRLEITTWRADGAAAGTPLSVPVVHGGATIGEIRVEPPAGGLAPAQRDLLAGLVRGAGLVLHNARLALELERRLNVISEQAAVISASRKRIATAQAEERRMLERNLHDGAQPHLVALRMSLGLAAHTLAGDSVPDTGAVLGRIAAQADGARASLGEIAQGLYPPGLVDEGLCAALRAHVSALDGEITLAFDRRVESARFSPDVEAALCFACLEALQNARKYASSGEIRLALARDGEGVRFTVADIGPGIEPDAARGFGLQSMEDRVAAVGGTLEFRSRPGEGMIVSGWVPADAPPPEASQLRRASGPGVEEMQDGGDTAV
jgi:signal transduction histidine kinase